MIEESIKEKNIELEVKKTICDATRLRQEETKALSLKVDAMIIIGGKHSSNTNKLYEIAKANCRNSILIESNTELNKDEIKKYKKVGIVTAADIVLNCYLKKPTASAVGFLYVLRIFFPMLANNTSGNK